MYGAEKINSVASQNENLRSEETNRFPSRIRISPSPSPRCQHYHVGCAMSVLCMHLQWNPYRQPVIAHP
ncbi:hypothetical protein V2G26_003413 [Clonostachys chloroleuca]